VDTAVSDATLETSAVTVALVAQELLPAPRAFDFIMIPSTSLAVLSLLAFAFV
jgi:hypothetical protein